MSLDAARPRLNIVTAVSRPENLPIIQRHLRERLTGCDLRWYCVADANHVRAQPRVGCEFWSACETPDRAGGAQKNVALEAIDDGWVYFLDDDNTIHPGFNAALTRVLAEEANLAGMIFGQAGGDGRMIRDASRRQVRLGRLDLGQFVLRRDVIGARRFPLDVYHSDWLFFEPIWREHHERFAFGGVATFYNALADGAAGFRHDWFSQNRPLFERWLSPLRGRPRVRGVEVGCHEGRASCWLLEHVVTAPDSRLVCVDSFVGAVPTESHLAADRFDAGGRLIGLEERFWRNVRPFGERVALHRGNSFDVLRRLELGSFDFAYVDGSHQAADVLEDLVLCFRLLKSGGLLIADDYLWTAAPRELDRPRIGVDAFLSAFADRCEILHRDYAVVLRKR